MRTSDCNRFSDADIERIATQTFVERVDFHRELRSTNDRALHICQSDYRALPALILAERQIAGRGRGTNRWWATEGALTFSLLLDLPRLSGEDVSPAIISLVAAMGVAEALDALIEPKSGPPVFRVKWPNDVYVNGRKICGILPERPQDGAGPLIVGVGLNANNAMNDAPADVRAGAIALRDLDGQPRSLAEILIRLLQGLDRMLSRFATDVGGFPAQWRTRCLLTDTLVRATVANREVTGICRGITERGALILDTPQGRETLISATIHSFE